MEFLFWAQPRFFCELRKKGLNMIQGRGIKAFIYKFFMCKPFSHYWSKYLVQ